MAVSFPRLPRWLCGGNSKERERSKGSSSSSSSVSASLKKRSIVKKVKRGWRGGGSGGEEEKFGNVVFPEADDPEWSIGWVEPHGPGFKTDDADNDDNCGFVVLVPCYKKVVDASSGNVFFSTTPDVKSMEQLLSSMGKL